MTANGGPRVEVLGEALAEGRAFTVMKSAMSASRMVVLTTSLKSAPASARDLAHVRRDRLGLLLDGIARELHRLRLQLDLAADVQRVPGADRLRVRAERGGTCPPATTSLPAARTVRRRAGAAERVEARSAGDARGGAEGGETAAHGQMGASVSE